MQTNIVKQFTPKRGEDWLPHDQLTRSDTHTTYQMTLNRDTFLLNLHIFGNVLLCDIIRNMNRDSSLFASNVEADRILKTVLHRLMNYEGSWDHIAFSHASEESIIYFVHRILKPLQRSIQRDEARFSPSIMMVDTKCPTVFLSRGQYGKELDDHTIKRVAKITRDREWNTRTYRRFSLKDM